MAEGFKLDLSYVMEDSDSKKKDTINLFKEYSIFLS